MLPWYYPITPRIETTSLKPKRLNSDQKDSSMHGLELPISHTTHAFMVVEPLFNPTSITCKVFLRARDLLQEETPSSESLESSVGDDSSLE